MTESPEPIEEIKCQYRLTVGSQPVCQVVSELTGRELAECHVNDSACAFCLRCPVAPQVPNAVTASMSIGVAKRTGDRAFAESMLRRMSPHLNKPTAPNTKCVLRGPEVRQVTCKPCQANSLVPVLVPAYRCPKHGECTLTNTGVLPKIQACSTCVDRLEQSYSIQTTPVPQSVLKQIAARNPRERIQ